MANPRFNKQVAQPRGQVGRVKKAMGGGLMKSVGYVAGKIVGKQKNLPPFLKKKILAAKPKKKK